MTFKTEKISTGMPLQSFRRLKSGNPHKYWAAVCKRDDFQWITVELGRASVQCAVASDVRAWLSS
jgi:hypothetical protein